MHLSHVLSVLGLLATTSLSAPTEIISAPPGLAERAPDTLKSRNPILLVTGILNLASNAFDFISGIQEFFEDQEKREEEFVKKTLENVKEAYPEYNVLIYHNQKSLYRFADYVHNHYELDLPSPAGTKGYEIFVLTTGAFERAGDGGWRNWGVAGCRKVTDNRVVFGDQTNCPYK